MANEVLQERYEIQSILGEGALGRTMLAIDRNSGGHHVAVKELLPSRMKRWKDYDLFGRESDTLQSLSHPGIPSYIDDFVIRSEDSSEPDRLFLVQQFAPGKNLQDLLDGGKTFNEVDVRSILEKCLDVLDYLHHLNPSVIHRDIKPANIMMAENGRVMMIDFGAVRESVTSDGMGSTIVGTFGYMPPEQYAGRSLPATDIFALGASCVQLLSGRPPGELFEGLHAFKLPDDLPISIGFERVLLKMTDPNLHGRYQSVREIQADLSSSFLMAQKAMVTGDLPIPYDILPAPRAFPGFQLRDAYHGAPHTRVVIVTIAAILMTLVFPVTALVISNPIFALLGFFAVLMASLIAFRVSEKSRNEISVFRTGNYTLGEITGCFLSSSSSSTNLTYRYETDPGQFEHGCVSTTDEKYKTLRVGDPIGVIYLPDEKSEHVMYAVPAQYADVQKRGDRLLETDKTQAE